MEKRNTILLTVIAIATLLVAVVGATFAYFTAQTTAQGSGDSVETNTTNLKGATITFASADSKFDLLNYPGGLAVFGSKVTISKEEGQEDAEHEYQATYNLKIEYTNNTQTDLEWELWMVPKEYDGLEAEKTTICKLQQKTDATGKTMFWYADQSDNGLVETTACSGNAITTKLQNGTEQGGLGATKIATGKLKKEQSTKQTIDKNSGTDELDTEGYQSDLTQRTINTKDLQSKYYYLIVKYPNTGDQSADAGSQITVSLNLDGKPASTLYTPAA